MGDEFKTTRWSLVAAAGGDDDRAATTALAELCEGYWRPIYAFIRRRGYAADDAADMTQAFFLHLLEHRAIARADESRGRFRSYLLAAAHNFMENARLRSVTLRRGARVRHEPLDVIAAEREPLLSADDQESAPDRVFERHWALNLTARALERVRTEYEARGQRELFDGLLPLLTSELPATSAAEATGAAGPMDPARRAALHRARRRFAEAMRLEIRETVADGADVDDELRFLLRALTG